MDKLTAIKIKYQDGTYSNEIPLSALAQNIDWDDNYSIVDIIGDVDFSTDGSIQTQINNILAQKGANNGIATLNSSGQVPSSQLPSYVDDVLEYASKSAFPSTGESGKIYVDKATNLTYRWSGSAYVEISPSLALGETSSTAYRGDRGKTAYDHSQTYSGNPHNVTKSEVGLGNVGNFKAVSTVASQGLTDTEKSNARTNIGAGTSSLALGETSSTAYRGDRGKTAYDHSQKTSGNPHNVTKSDVGLGNVGNFKAVSTVASQGLSSTEQSNARANIGAGTSSFSGSYNDLSNKPTIPNKTSQLTNDSGFITTDTKNTAGSTDTSSKIFLIGATSQAANPQTYSHDTAYVGTDGQLYSGGNKVLTQHQTIKQDGVSGATANRFGVCSTNAGTAAKTVSITSGTFNLESGAQVSVKFSNTNSANNPTLNVNSTGAKNIFVNGSQITAGSEKSLLKGTVSFVYDGTQWHLIGGGSDSPPVMEMTKAQYDALTPEEQNNGTIYYIIDDEGNALAKDIHYDNTSSNLTSTNVQDALDEVNTHGTNICPLVTTDYNDAPVGFSKASGASAHAPFNFWSGLITLYHENGNYQQQLALPYTRSEARIAYRSKENGAWGDWQYFSRVQYQSDVYTNVNGNYVFLTKNPGNGYVLVNAYDGDWNNGNWKPNGIFFQSGSYGLFFDKELTNATIRIDSFWMKV